MCIATAQSGSVCKCEVKDLAEIWSVNCWPNSVTQLLGVNLANIGTEHRGI